MKTLKTIKAVVLATGLMLLMTSAVYADGQEQSQSLETEVECRSTGTYGQVDCKAKAKGEQKQVFVREDGTKVVMTDTVDAGLGDLGLIAAFGSTVTGSTAYLLKRKIG